MIDAADGFAQVYDVIYPGPPEFVAAQLAFLTTRLGAPPACLLDAGCGTGRHVAALAEAGYMVVGLDRSRPMLRMAQARVVRRMPGGESRAPFLLAQADLLSVPLRSMCFDGVLCLESPLAYCHTDDALAAAVGNLSRCLKPGARLIADIFDYAGTIGPDGLEPQLNRFPAPWGSVDVRETHRCDAAAGLWRMRQEFIIQRGARPVRFVVEHHFALRSADGYAAALEDAGFVIEDLLPQYPGAPLETADEQRMIFVARKKGDR